MVLTLDDCVVESVGYDFLFLSLQHLLVVLAFLLRIWFAVYLGLFFALVQELLEEIGEFHFDQHRALPSILPMAIAHGEEVLMVRLANVWGQDKVVLILLIDVMDAEAFSGGIGKPRDHIVLNDLRSFLRFVPLYFEWVLLIVDDSVVVIDSLIRKGGRLRDAWNEALHWPSHWVIIHGQLVLDQWARVRGASLTRRCLLPRCRLRVLSWLARALPVVPATTGLLEGISLLAQRARCRLRRVYWPLLSRLGEVSTICRLLDVYLIERGVHEDVLLLRAPTLGVGRGILDEGGMVGTASCRAVLLRGCCSIY